MPKRADLSKYARLLAENDIGIDVLRDVTDEEWRALGVSLGDLKRLHRALDEVSEQSPEPTMPAGDVAPTSAWARTPDDHRPVTLLYVDITGSTALTGTLNSEHAHSVLYGAVELLCNIVEAHRGTVGRFMGDGLMALFGVPDAYEGHARG